MRIRSAVGVTRFELVTSCSQGRRANQAALHPATSIRHSHRKRTQAYPVKGGSCAGVCADKPTQSIVKRALESFVSLRR